MGVGEDPTAALGTVETDGCPALEAWITIPNLSPDGIQPIPLGVTGFQDTVCGNNFGVEGANAAQTVAQPLTSRTKPFVLSLYSTSAAIAMVDNAGPSTGY